MRKRRERVCFISKHLCFPRFENINVLEALAKQRCVPIGKQNVYQWSASLLESSLRHVIPHRSVVPLMFTATFGKRYKIKFRDLIFPHINEL